LLVDFVIKGGTIVTPYGRFSGSIAIDEGKIVAIGSESSMPNSDRTIDSSGRFVMSGAIDPHIHLGLGVPFPEDCITETAAAAAGGVTTVGDFFRSLKSYHEVFPDIKRGVEANCIVDMFFSFGIMRRQQIPEIGEYAQKHGVTTFKFYGKYGLELMSYRQQAPPEVVEETDDGLLLDGLVEIARVLGDDGMGCIHAENYELIHTKKEEMKRNGMNDLTAWSDSRPNYCEEEYMAKAIYLSKVAGVRLYNVHMSVGKGVGIVEQAMKEGAKIIAETCPHYLVLNKHMNHLGVRGKISPPLRDVEDVQLLWNGIANGIVKTIGSDHVIVPKETDDIWKAFPGVPGVETLLPIILGEGVRKGRITLERANEVCSRNPALAFGLYPRKGSITVGSDADIVMVDMNEERKISANDLHSKAGWTPYEGLEIKGWPVMTMNKGEIVYEDRQVIGRPGHGRYIPRPIAAQRKDAN
jgi:dihydroorotase (multifunctional complex type)